MVELLQDELLELLVCTDRLQRHRCPLSHRALHDGLDLRRHRSVKRFLILHHLSDLASLARHGLMERRLVLCDLPNLIGLEILLH